MESLQLASTFDPERLEADMRRLGSRAPGLVELHKITRAQHPEVFALADELHEVAQGARLRAYEEAHKTPLGSPKGLATLLLGRAVETFESCIILCERGRPTDAIALGRLLVEADILAAGLTDGSDATRAYLFEQERSGDASRARLFSEVFARPEDGPELQSAIQARLSELAAAKEDGVQRPILRKLAESTDSKDAYYLYKEFSNEGAHVGLANLLAQASRDEAGQIDGFKVGPNIDEAGAAMSKIILAMIGVASLVLEIHGWKEMRATIESLADRNLALVA